MPLARRWPPGRRAVAVGPHPNLAGVASRRGLPCAEAPSGRGEAGHAGEGIQRRPGAGSPYRRRPGSSPRPRRAALLPPAPPVPPRLPPSPPPPPPPAPPRRLIDGSLKKSPRSRAASAGELRHSRSPASSPHGAAPPRAQALAHPGAAPPPAPRAPARGWGDLGDSEGRGSRGLPPQPQHRKEKAHLRRRKFEPRTKERASPQHFF